MSLTESAYTILRKLFKTPNFEKYRLPVNSEEGDFLVIPGNGAPRWIVPTSAKYGFKVLSDWNPYGISSQIKWQLLCLFYRFNLLAKVPGVVKVLSELYSDGRLIEGAQQQESKIIVIPVIYVGTPGPQQKAVVTLVDAKSKEAVAVMKIALGKQANNSIMQEANMLIQLAKLGVQNVPDLITENKELGVTLQTVLLGKLSPRCFNKAHLNFLLTLPESGEKTTYLDQKKKLLTLFTDVKSSFTLTQHMSISKAIDNITSVNSIGLVLIHGDFTPWNIKQTVKEECKLIDWEDAKLNGLPFWDICHFFFMQACLFNETECVSQFSTAIYSKNSLINNYLTQKYIAFSDSTQLVLLYILYSVFNENTNFEYKIYLIEQVLPVFNNGLKYQNEK